MAKKGGTKTKFYRETHGVKVSGGQLVRCGTILTREGHRWKSGLNVLGRMHLTAACDGEVYFTKKRGHYNRTVTFIHIRPVAEKKSSKKTKEKSS
jgi:ribosomal protein L27